MMTYRKKNKRKRNKEQKVLGFRAYRHGIKIFKKIKRMLMLIGLGIQLEKSQNHGWKIWRKINKYIIKKKKLKKKQRKLKILGMIVMKKRLNGLGWWRRIKKKLLKEKDKGSYKLINPSLNTLREVPFSLTCLMKNRSLKNRI